jgi:cytoskeletal protein CcmA (bactofilin family)
MKNERRSPQSGMDVYISAESQITGDSTTQNNIVVEGQVNGKITATGNVHIGSAAKIEGNIAAADIQIAGRVQGNVSSSGVIVLYSGAQLEGDVRASGITIEKGASFKGATEIDAENAAAGMQPES